MRIELDNLEGEGKFSQTYEPGELSLSDERVTLAQPATVSGVVKRLSGEVEVRGRISTRVNVECDRCLRYVEVPVETRFNLNYVTPQTYEATAGAELQEEDMSLAVFDGEAIEVDELVDEQIMLTLPSRVLCDETCKGLCPICGKDRNQVDCSCESSEIDPRWSALKELVDGK